MSQLNHPEQGPQVHLLARGNSVGKRNIWVLVSQIKRWLPILDCAFKIATNPSQCSQLYGQRRRQLRGPHKTSGREAFASSHMGEHLVR